MEKVEKYVIQLTYLGGLACMLVALVWRGLNYLGYGMPRLLSPGQDLYYMSFYRAALILLVASISASMYATYNRKA